MVFVSKLVPVSPSSKADRVFSFAATSRSNAGARRSNKYPKYKYTLADLLAKQTVEGAGVFKIRGGGSPRGDCSARALAARGRVIVRGARFAGRAGSGGDGIARERGLSADKVRGI